MKTFLLSLVVITGSQANRPETRVPEATGFRPGSALAAVAIAAWLAHLHGPPTPLPYTASERARSDIRVPAPAAAAVADGSGSWPETDLRRSRQ